MGRRADGIRFVWMPLTVSVCHVFGRVYCITVSFHFSFFDPEPRKPASQSAWKPSVLLSLWNQGYRTTQCPTCCTLPRLTDPLVFSFGNFCYNVHGPAASSFVHALSHPNFLDGRVPSGDYLVSVTQVDTVVQRHPKPGLSFHGSEAPNKNPNVVAYYRFRPVTRILTVDTSSSLG